MHARVALYKLTSGTIGDVAAKVANGLLPVFRDQEGFRGYELIEGDDETVISVSRWDSEEQAEEAAETAATWVRESIADHLTLEQIHVGEAVLTAGG
jgi:heme-degrading monooxygenase HmoA